MSTEPQIYELILIGFMIVGLLVVLHHVRFMRRKESRKEKFKWQ